MPETTHPCISECHLWSPWQMPANGQCFTIHLCQRLGRGLLHCLIYALSVYLPSPLQWFVGQDKGRPGESGKLQGPVATSIRSSNSNKPFVKKTAPAPHHPYTVCKQHSFLCNFLCLMSLHSPSLQCMMHCVITFPALSPLKVSIFMANMQHS